MTGPVRGRSGAAVRVRPARPDDLPALAPLWRALDADHARLHPGLFRAAPRPAAEALAALRDPAAILLVAEPPGAPAPPVGLALARLHDAPDLPGVAPRRRCHLEELVVQAAARRRGVARSLLAAVERSAAARGAAELVLTVWSGNRAARALYRRAGIDRLGEVLAKPLR